MADEGIVIRIGGDAKDFEKTIEGIVSKSIKAADKSGGAFDDAFKIRSLNDLKAGFNLVTQAVGKVVEELDKFRQFILETAVAGEKLKGIEKQFDNIALSSGLAGESIKQSLLAVTGTGATNSEVLAATSKAFIQLGAAAGRSAEVLEIAKKAAGAFGGTALEQFEAINNAISSGSSKSLKAIGLNVDLGAAYKQVAKELGISVDLLTQEQKQRIASNAIIEKSATAYKGLVETQKPATDSLRDLAVATSEASEAFKRGFSAAFGETIAAVNRLLTHEAEQLTLTLKTLNGEVISGADKLRLYGDELSRLQKLQSQGVEVSKDRVNFLQNELDKVNELTEAEFQRSLKRGQAASIVDQAPSEDATGGGVGAGVFLDPKQIAEQNRLKLEKEKEFRSQLAVLDQEQLSRRAQNAQLITDQDTKALELESIRLDQLALLQEQFEIKKQEIATNFSDLNNGTAAQRKELELEALRSFNLEKERIEVESERAKSAKKLEIQNLFLNAAKQTAALGVKQLAISLNSGENLFKNFTKGILGLIADQVIQLGEALVIQGLAIEKFIASINTLLPGSGAAAAAAGLGLILFGSALKAAVGSKGGSSGGASSSAGGGGTTSGSFATDTSSLEAISEKTTKVAINVEGTVLDPIGVGQQIAQVLQQTFDATGTKVVTT
jgi:hypothetical protein